TKQTFTLYLNQETKPTLDQEQKQALHIPMRVGLYTQSGAPIELPAHKKAAQDSQDVILDFKQDSQSFTFEGIAEAPVIALLCEFSAPVKLDYPYCDQDLMHLMMHCQNEFARWDASQSLLGKYIRQNIEAYQQQEAMQLPDAVIDAMRGVLLSDALEPAFIAQMLTLPSANEVAGWLTPIDVDAIDASLGFIKAQLAGALEDEFSAIYHSLKQTGYEISHPAMGQRALRNVCLSYLAHLDVGNELAQSQYQSATNMTDTMAALSAANQAQLPCREALMQDFSDKWSHDGLVMDKWFMLQGANPSEQVLENLKQTMSHPAFSLNNPNRLRSLVGAFFNQNPVRFHALDGSGYAFAGDILEKLNQINPQVASRMIDPLLKYRLYDETRQALIRSQLERLAKLDDLAKDLFEKINKALSI
ncbi:MAG: DUF3458 domain-containing protein, partial [Vibrio sp.]